MKSVLVAMSGGVDSSVAAALLLEQGYTCHGIMLIMHGNEKVEDAAEVCTQLNIPFYTIDVRENFRSCVISDFINSYKDGETPNPCVRCNHEVKLKSILQEADKLGIEYIATGHYACVVHAKDKDLSVCQVEDDLLSGQASRSQTGSDNAEYDPLSRTGGRIPADLDNEVIMSEEFGTGVKRNLLYKGKDRQKDQSYMLYRLSQEQLGRLLLPLGDYSKDEVRRIACRLGLATADRGDSQDLCFVPDGDYVSYIEREIGEQKPGAIVTKQGEVLGTHSGLINYTVGQRKGLGIALGEPYYVIRKDKERNEIVLGKEADMYTDSIRVREINLVAVEEIPPDLEVEVQTRYRASAVQGRLRQVSADIIDIAFNKKEKAPAPGQSAVFYIGDMVVGGGIVE